MKARHDVYDDDARPLNHTSQRTCPSEALAAQQCVLRCPSNPAKVDTFQVGSADARESGSSQTASVHSLLQWCQLSDSPGSDEITALSLAWKYLVYVSQCESQACIIMPRLCLSSMNSLTLHALALRKAWTSATIVDVWMAETE